MGSGTGSENLPRRHRDTEKIGPSDHRIIGPSEQPFVFRSPDPAERDHQILRVSVPPWWISSNCTNTYLRMRRFMSPFALIYNQIFPLGRFFRQGVFPCQRLFTTLPLSALAPEATQPPFALVNWA